MGTRRSGRTGVSSWLVMLAGLGLLATACSSPGSSPSVAATTPAGTTTPEGVATTDTATASPSATPAGVTSPLGFTARLLDGGTFDGTEHRGTDVVLWMWAPWCPQCNREAPHVAEAVRRYGDRVAFVGVPGHDSDAAHRAFVDEHGLDGMTHVVDEDGSLWARFGINYQPAWVFVDDDGTSQVVAGGLYDELDGRIQDLVDG